MSDTWHPIATESDLAENGKHSTIVNDWHLLIVQTDEGIRVYNDRCTHAASPLSTGRIRRGAVMCPLHGARFELTTGRCIGGAYRDLIQFEHRVDDGEIHALIPDRKPGLEELPVAPAR